MSGNGMRTSSGMRCLRAERASPDPDRAHPIAGRPLDHCSNPDAIVKSRRDEAVPGVGPGPRRWTCEPGLHDSETAFAEKRVDESTQVLSNGPSPARELPAGA